MKKIYAIVLLAVMAAVSTSGVFAESVTFRIQDTDAVSIRISGSYLNLTAGDNVIEYNPTDYQTVYIDAKDGFRLQSVECVDSPENNLYVSSGMSASLYLTPYVDGRVYEINTQNLAELRTASVTVTVTDDYNQVVGYRTGTGKFELTGETTEVKFIPGEESPLMFSSKDYKPLYLVKLNGNKVTSSGSQVNVPVADGDEIEITVNFPDVDVPVTITIPEDAKGAIKAFRVNYEEVSNYYDEDFALPAGSTFSIDFDTNNYQIGSVTINDEPQPTYYVSYTLGVDPVDVVIDAHPFGTLDFVLNVDDPSHITVYPGQSQYSAEPFELAAGENHLSVGENNPYIYLKLATGYFISSITDGDGVKLVPQYNSLQITDGMTINITTDQLVLDGKFALYIDSLEGVYSATWSDEESREYHNISEAGYTVIPFATQASILYMVSVSGSNPYYAYKNNEAIQNLYTSSYFTQQSYPENGDVYKVYTQGEAPDFFEISFQLFGEGTEDVQVVTDLINLCPDFTSGLTVLTGTNVAVYLPENGDFTVTLDGEDLEADDNGAYSFAATADHSVVVKAFTGISNVAAEGASCGPVYNLQGVKVLDHGDPAAINALPAGIYITNGTKVVVR
ncbi:MAG: hypothetical protein K2G07_05050 [Muribaculaceae bacterium]|nr:hypothetical protein [Muribaculaceae bacterium]